MYNKDFYPTPNNLIYKLILGIKNGSNILEPSAGKGNILDLIDKNIEKDCIEIEPELINILKNKGYRVVHNNFLTFNTGKTYDYIIANFPFSDGDKHLYKAIQLQKRNGGYLHCIVNAETIRNRFSSLRELVYKELQEADEFNIEYLENTFLDAERKTDVEIALIKAKFTQEEYPSVILDSLQKNIVNEEEENFTEIETKDAIGNLINRYNIEFKIGRQIIKEFNRIKPLIDRNITSEYKSCIIEMKIDGIDATINLFIKKLRRKYWQLFISNDTVKNKYSRKTLDELYNKLTELEDYDFSRFNIEQIQTELNSKIVVSIERDILSLFDELSQQYHYSEFSDNVHMFTGWKTNKCWKINTKVIIPFYVLDTRYSSLYFDRYKAENKLNDILRVLNYLGGKDINTNNIVRDAIDNAIKNEDYKNIDLGVITLTFYKKGTCHIVFNDKDLLDKFNIFGSQKKGWLPPSYGKKYDDMTKEEQSIIDDFQGRNNYENIINNKDYYLNTNTLYLQ